MTQAATLPMFSTRLRLLLAPQSLRIG